jgi:hypothetical protein
MNRELVIVALALAAAAGCASYPSPEQHFAESIAAVRGAEEGGAAAEPQAALNLRLAQNEANRARALLEEGKNEQADYMSLRAKADADLALAMTRESSARARAEQTEAKERNVEQRAHVAPPE